MTEPISQDPLDPADVVTLGMLYSPIPCWFKGIGPEYRMLIINQAYEKTYGIPGTVYKGKTDADIWGADTAKAFLEADTLAETSGLPVWHWETFKSAVSGLWEKSLVVKWPVYYKSILIGIAGMIIRREVSSEKLSPASIPAEPQMGQS